MKITIKSIAIADGKLVVEPTPESAHNIYQIVQAVKVSKKGYVADFTPVKVKRSLDANGAMWQLLTMMADLLHTTKDDLYLEVLDRYGVFTHIIVKREMVERVKKEWKLVRELGEVTVNGKTGSQLQCFFGSSTYDSKEFSVLLDGVIQEAEDMDIHFISREEQSRLIAEWGK